MDFGYSLHVKSCLFATLFTSYFTLEHRIGSGPSGAEIFEITPVLIETFILLTSSFVIGLAIHAMRLGRQKAMMVFFGITLLLGLAFLGVEIYEFVTLCSCWSWTSNKCIYCDFVVNIRNTWCTRYIWFVLGIAIMLQVKKHGLNPRTANKSFIFSLYWHFLDVVWIFIFSFIYLKGMM